jgi:DNA-binding MarR family transcriptional regulator
VVAVTTTDDAAHAMAADHGVPVQYPGRELPSGAPGGGIGFLLRWAHVRAARSFEAGLAPLGIEPKHFGVLSFLTVQPRSQRALVDLTGSDKASMVRTIDELESRGLVRRAPDPHDRRAHAVTLTDEGRAVLTRARRVGVEVSETLLAHLSQAQREQLRDLLAQFLRGPTLES